MSRKAVVECTLMIVLPLVILISGAVLAGLAMERDVAAFAPAVSLPR